MSYIGCLDGLEVAFLREVGGCTVGREERAFLVAEWNSFLMRESRGDHQGFER